MRSDLGKYQEGEGKSSDSTGYPQLVEHYPELQDTAHRAAFDKFVERMWTKPTTYKAYLQAYLEFTTPEKPAYRKLNDMEKRRRQTKQSSKRKRRRRRSRRKRRRSSSQRKK